MWRKTLRLIALGLFQLLSRFESFGINNIPRKGACIFAANHLGIVDAAMGFVLPERNDINGFVADKHRKNPVLRFLINSIGGIWIRRGEPDRKALRAALDHLQNGGLFGIAPEGTRSPTIGLIKGHIGAAYLADKSGAPVVPIAFHGTEGALKKMFTFQRPALTVRVGEPFHLPPTDPANRAASLEANTDEIMCRIAALLPPEYRGVYSDHRRLKELLAS